MASSTPGLIGVFDSGVGGLSVLRALRRRAAYAPVLYVADSGFAPYGDRDPSHVLDRSQKVAGHLIEQGARMIIVACNTATAHAISSLRESHPKITWVGVEPGIKPAVAQSKRKCVGVLTTPSTLKSERFASLIERFAGECKVIGVPCQGLAAAIERGGPDATEIDPLLDQYCAPVREAQADVVVLGCTHYPFVAERIALRLPADVQLLDTADAVARHAVHLWPHDTADITQHMPVERAPAKKTKGAPLVRLQTTGDPVVLSRLAHEGLGLHIAADVISL
jgi:glutamate racemase